MIRISLPYIFRLSSEIDVLKTLPEEDTDLGRIWYILFSSLNAITALYENSVYTGYLRSSYSLARELSEMLRHHTEGYQAEKKINSFELWQIKTKYVEYKTALLSELEIMDIYLITRKAGYDTYSLLNSGEVIYPVDLRMKVPEALADARESAKCLAYETATAAGFHIFRMIECVLIKYYISVNEGKSPPKVRSIGAYLAALEEAKKGDPRVLATLKQIKDLHRNPLIHPEAELKIDDAVALAGIARSVLTAMLAEIPIPPPPAIVPK